MKPMSVLKREETFKNYIFETGEEHILRPSWIESFALVKMAEELKELEINFILKI